MTGWLIMYHKQLKNAAGKAFSRVKNSAKKTLKRDVDNAAEKENQEGNIDLTLHENEKAFNGAFKSFMIPSIP